MTDDAGKSPNAAGSPDSVDAIVQAWKTERPGTPTADMRVVTQIWQLAKIFGDGRRRTVNAEDADLATLDLLSTLRRAGPPYELSTRELTRRSMVTAGAISQRLARAERDALIVRSRIPGQHTVLVTLTDDGHRLVERLVDDIADTDRAMLSGLTAAQRDDLDALLTALLDDLRSRFDVGGVSQVGDI